MILEIDVANTHIGQSRPRRGASESHRTITSFTAGTIPGGDHRQIWTRARAYKPAWPSKCERVLNLITIRGPRDSTATLQVD
jgi:hypothetical protein